MEDPSTKNSKMNHDNVVVDGDNNNSIARKKRTMILRESNPMQNLESEASENEIDDDDDAMVEENIVKRGGGGGKQRKKTSTAVDKSSLNQRQKLRAARNSIDKSKKTTVAIGWKKANNSKTSSSAAASGQSKANSKSVAKPSAASAKSKSIVEKARKTIAKESAAAAMVKKSKRIVRSRTQSSIVNNAASIGSSSNPFAFPRNPDGRFRKPEKSELPGIKLIMPSRGLGGKFLSTSDQVDKPPPAKKSKKTVESRTQSRETSVGAESAGTSSSLVLPARNPDGTWKSKSDVPSSSKAKRPIKEYLHRGEFYNPDAPLEKARSLTDAFNDYVARANLTPQEFLLPYDMWYFQKKQKSDLSDPSRNYHKIKANNYMCDVPLVKKDVCSCKVEDKCGDECWNRRLFIECDPNQCPCKKVCTNNRMQKREQLQCIEKFECGEKGTGVRTNARIENGTFICEYVGEVVTQETFNERSRTWYKDCKHHYALTLDGGAIIDAYRSGNIARFLNHSCKPNCEMEKWAINGYYRMGIFALREIQPDEELTFDYKFHAFKEAQRCYCQSENCRGMLIHAPAADDHQRKSKPTRSGHDSVNDLFFRRDLEFHAIIATSRREKCVAIKKGILLNRNVNYSRQQIKSRVTEEAIQSNVVDDAAKAELIKRHLREMHSDHRKFRLLAKSGIDIVQLKKLLALARHMKTVQSTALRTRTRRHTIAKQISTAGSEGSSGSSSVGSINESITDFDAVVVKAMAGQYHPEIASFEQDIRAVIDYLKAKTAQSSSTEEAEELFSTMHRSYAHAKLALFESSSTEVAPAVVEKKQLIESDWASRFPLVGTYDSEEGTESIFSVPADKIEVMDDDKVHCVCGRFFDSGTMVQCDECRYWQHCDCLRIIGETKDYVCVFCKSNDLTLRKEVVSIPQPSDRMKNCTYYEAFFANDLHVHSGEFVYVKRDADFSKAELLESKDNVSMDDDDDDDEIELQPNMSSPIISKKAVVAVERSKSVANCRGMYRRNDLRIVRIIRLIKGPNGDKFVFGIYYLYPHETIFDIGQKFHQNEVCESKIFRTFSIDDVIGRCLVLDEKTYRRGKPKYPKFAEDDIYVCCNKLTEGQQLYRRSAANSKILEVPTKPYLFETFPEKRTMKRDFEPFLIEKKMETAQAINEDQTKPKTKSDIRKQRHKLESIVDKLGKSEK